MTTARPRSPIGTLAACLALLATQVLVSFATPAISNTPCEELRAWAEPYQGATPTLDHLARFDRAHRLALFGALSPEVRSGLWREQLQRFDARAALTAEQRALVKRAVELATPELYGGGAASNAAYRQLWPQVSQVFPSAGHRRIFFDLGAIVPGVVLTTARVPYCECHQGEQSGCFNGCISAPCNSYNPGCGAIGALECNGMCR